MDEQTIAPPVARRDETVTTLHGHQLVDEYAWLREKTSPEVIAFLEQENAYTRAVMKPTEELQGRLYTEMLSHIKESDVSVPFRDKQHYYYSRTEQGAQYPIYCRKHGSLEAPEEIILDMNQMAAGEGYLALGALTVSDDGYLLAYSTDTTGFRQYTLHIKDLRTGEVLPDQAERVGSVVWAADNRTLFYSVEDEETKRQYQLFRHTLGASQSSDVLVFEEADERFNVGAGRTRDDKYLVFESASHTTSEARFLPADQPRRIVDDDRAAAREHRVLRRPSRRLLVSAGERYREDLSPGRRSGGNTRSRALARTDRSPGRRHAGRCGAVPGVRSGG